MCAANAEYQFINPTTQVALYSICVGTCTGLISINWLIYQGTMNQSSNTVQWTLLNLNNSVADQRFFGRIAFTLTLTIIDRVFIHLLGRSTSNFTATNQLFQNESIGYWRFEAIYTFTSESSSSALNFRINQPPINGSCSIDLSNGSTSTVFTISCSQWTDEDGIKDYAIYSEFLDPILIFYAFFYLKQKILTSNF